MQNRSNALAFLASSLAVASAVASKPRNAAVAIMGGLGALVGTAHAAVDEEITTAITTAGADLLTVAGAVTGIMAALWAAMLIKRKFFG
jgi:hypothetical protein